MYYCSIGNRGDATVTVGSSIDAKATVQSTTEGDDIYSVVSDNSIGDLGLHSSCQDNQSTHALPYEVAVFHGQSLPDDAQNLQYATDPKAALKPCDESDQNKHNQRYRENQMSDQTKFNDEHHVYDEVNHETKVKGQNNSIISVANETACHRDGNDKELVTDSELFDDMVYSMHPLQTIGTSRAAQQIKTNTDSMSQQNSKGRNVYAKSATNMNEDDYAESAAIKKQKGQVRFNDEHLYDSADQLSKSQTATLTTIRGDNNNTKFNAEADETKHSQESPETGSQVNPEMPTGHLSTTVQDINSQSADCDPTLYNCQFDDPMYESTPHSGANLKAAATKNSMKADVIEPQEESMQSNTELVRNYSGDVESYGDAPQHSDPTDLVPMDNHVTADSQDEADRKLTSIYDMFDDPTYGVCVTLDPTK